MLAASEDALTGALLRNTFEDDVTAWLTRGAQQGFDVSLLVIDLDYLKLINDAFGHLAGDSALATVAAYIRQHLHSDDLLFRYGGDEFVVLLPNTSLEQASQRAQEILITTLTTPLHIAVPTSASAQVAITSQTVAPTQDSLQNPLQEISLSLSIGVASMPAPEPVRTVQALFAQADARAYLSKKLGRGRVTDNDPTAPTDTRDHSQSQLDELTEIRLLGREDVLERVRDILKAPLTPTAKRAMWIYGKAGSGMSRVLAYAASLATMLGQVVIHLEATPARKLRWLGALSEAVLPVPWLTWQNLCQPELVLRTLEQHNATSNVVVILDRVDLLDRDSREYITALLTALPRVILLYSSNHNQPDGYAYDGHSDPYDETLHRGFDVVTRVYLAPLSLTDVARWLQGSTGYAASVAGSVQQQPEMLTAPFTETSSTQVSSTQVSSTQVSSTTTASTKTDDALDVPALPSFLEMVYELTQGLPAQVALVVRALEAGLLSPSTSVQQQRQRLEEVLSGQFIGSLLPPVKGVFVGRYKALDRIKRWLRPGALVSVVGADGMGKSRLALQVARECDDRFLGGVYWVSLAPLTPSETLIYAIAEAMNVSFGNVQGPQAPVFNALRQAPTLLVLDNVSPAPGVLEVIHTLQQHAPQTTLLITSPEALKLANERSFHLTGLPPLKAADDISINSSFGLFTAYARQAAPAQTFHSDDATLLDAIQVIHDAVAGMPLGLELAAAWCGVYSPQAIAELLQQDKLVLDTDLSNADNLAKDDEMSLPSSVSGISPATSLPATELVHVQPERSHTPLRGVLEAFWQLLSKHEQQVLASLTVFPEYFVETMARQVAGASPFFLASLWHKSFLVHGYQTHQRPQQQGEGRYEMPLLLRQFAATKLAQQPSWQRQAEQALVMAYMTWLNELEVTMWDERQAVTFQLIHSNIDTIDKAWRLLASLDSSEVVGDAAASLDPDGKITALLRNYYEVFAGQTRRGAALFANLADIFAQTQPRFASFQAYAATRLWSRAGDLGRSQQAAAQTLTLLEQSPDPTGKGFAEIAWIHHLSAENQMSSGHYSYVLESLEAAVNYFDKLGHKRGWVAAMIGHGKWYILQADYGLARHYITTALAQARQLNLRVGKCLSLHYLGAVATAVQAWEEASQHLNACIDNAQEIGFERAEALSHLSLARCVTRRAGIGFATGFLASGHVVDPIAAHQLARARWHLDQARQCWERKGLTVELIYTLHELASLAYEEHHVQEARSYLRRALIIAKDTAFIPSLLSCLAVFACYELELTMVARVVRVIYHHPAASPRLRNLITHQFGDDLDHFSKQHAPPASGHALVMLSNEILERLSMTKAVA